MGENVVSLADVGLIKGALKHLRMLMDEVDKTGELALKAGLMFAVFGLELTLRSLERLGEKL
jgi:hypothetical protein